LIAKNWAGLSLFVSVLATAPHAAFAQTPTDPRQAQPERPSVATHAYPVAPGFLELESGFLQQPRPGSALLQTTPILLKIGLAPRMQLDVSPGWLQVTDQDTRVGGLTDLALGLKWQLTDNTPFLGSFAVQPSATFATGSVQNDTGIGAASVSVLVISSHQFGRVSLDLNAGYTHRGGDGTVAAKNATLWTISTSTQIYQRLSWCAELFGFPRTHGPAGEDAAVGFLFGPTVELNRRVVVDGGVVFDVKELGGNQVYTGVTWNLGQIFRY